MPVVTGLYALPLPMALFAGPGLDGYRAATL
jgi:hypothetical protein